MSKDIKERISDTADKLVENYVNQEMFDLKTTSELPKKSEVIKLIELIRSIIFPGYLGEENLFYVSRKVFAGNILATIYEKLLRQICVVLSFRPDYQEMAENFTGRFVEYLPDIQEIVYKDVQAQFMGDPAAGSKEEVIISYPGLFAIFVYRIAHELYKLKIPFIPRIMTEYAHEKTGIDIHPGAEIGEYFFIDHGTGIVIGETTVIGDRVKIYQGVTLGARSLQKGQALAGTKRHPTIEDNVVIYANATILGGDTVIGKDSVIAGNTFVVESVPANTTVSANMPELRFKNRM